MVPHRRYGTPRELVLAPDARLREVSSPVTDFGDDFYTLVEDMVATMYKHNGVGLAAVQVGVPLRVLVVDVSPSQEDLHVLVNPTIQSFRTVVESDEGCLSVPGEFVPKVRHGAIRVQAQSRHGTRFLKTYSGFQAVAIQHEIDHLDGKLITD